MEDKLPNSDAIAAKAQADEATRRFEAAMLARQAAGLTSDLQRRDVFKGAAPFDVLPGAGASGESADARAILAEFKAA